MSAGHPTPPSLCPECGYTVDRASAIGKSEAKPQPGDLSVCLDCGAAVLFDAALRLRRPYPGELEAAGAEDPELLAWLERHQAVIRSLPPLAKKIPPRVQ